MTDDTPSTGRAGRTTLAAVAADAGVSVATVSKVLNGRGDISAQTRSKVQSLLVRHGYQPASTRRRVGIVDMLIDNMSSSWSAELARGAVEAAAEHAVSVAITTRQLRGTAESGWIDQVLRRGTDGLIVVLDSLTAAERELLDAGIPCVLLDPVGEPQPGFHMVGATNWQGGLDATLHLVELGHRAIACLGGPPEHWCARARLDGYYAALARNGVPVRPELVRTGEFQEESGHRLMAELLDLPEPPTAVFACDDVLAMGAIKAAAEHGLAVPHDLSVVGFDDVPFTQWTAPPLTTVRQPLAAMAETAVRILMQRDRTSSEPQRMELATKLIVRGSTAPPAG
ncbi:LacI family DNA-binding transcriptional regulator [Streptomyces sp. NPDC048409]|uniref:LacI family DNA-binding transcriptional regulator n=1 Tax=Streptomyces sp. NPDC048409 TaxID=3154723 RepID=UPI00342A87F6